MGVEKDRLLKELELIERGVIKNVPSLGWYYLILTLLFGIKTWIMLHDGEKQK